MKYERKTRDYWSIQCKYLGEWEEVCEEETRRDAHNTYVDYCMNDSYAEDTRVVKKKVKI